MRALSGSTGSFSFLFHREGLSLSENSLAAVSESKNARLALAAGRPK
jgi:hypothetical protein